MQRRTLLQAGLAGAAASALPSWAATTPANSVRFFACSGFLSDNSRTEAGIRRLQNAGFALDNTQALSRRWYRFSGTDAERAADLQDVATGKAATPKLLLGARGGYGAMRILPLVDWQRLGARMRESGTLLMGYSDVCALQLALLAQAKVGSFAGPLLYSEFGSPWPSQFGMQSFINACTQPSYTVPVASSSVPSNLDISGIWWGGNLTMLAALAGSPYMPQIDGGILFLEDVGEQPYRLERMLQTLHLAGILKRQRAIVLGTFRLSKVRDMYDDNYDFAKVMTTLRQLTGIPVLTDFPSGHIREKITMPLGYMARLRSSANGYQVSFANYPYLDAKAFNADALMAGTVAASEPAALRTGSED